MPTAMTSATFLPAWLADNGFEATPAGYQGVLSPEAALHLITVQNPPIVSLLPEDKFLITPGPNDAPPVPGSVIILGEAGNIIDGATTVAAVMSQKAPVPVTIRIEGATS